MRRWNCPCPPHEGKCWRRDTAPLILNIGTGWREVVRLMPRPFYPRSPLSLRNVWGRFGEEKDSWSDWAIPWHMTCQNVKRLLISCADGLLYWFVYGLMCLIQSLITLLCLRGTHSCRPRRSLHCRTSFKVEGRYVSHCFQIATNSLSKWLSEFSKILCYAVWVWNLVCHSKGTRYAVGVGE
jgi:hypothetical protein